MASAHLFVVAAMLSATPPSPARTIERAMFKMPLAQFIALADSGGRDGRLDWSSDGCSAPLVGGTGRSFDFTAACRRHDFGYRNYKVLDGGRHWTAALRRRIDGMFLSDMLTTCAPRPRAMRAMCRGWARTFHRAVRTYGGL